MVTKREKQEAWSRLVEIKSQISDLLDENEAIKRSQALNTLKEAHFQIHNAALALSALPVDDDDQSELHDYET